MINGQVRRAKFVFLAVFVFTSATIMRPIDASVNTWSRMSLAFSIVERHALDIGPYLTLNPSEDWSYAHGRFYSNKAPGPALLAAPLYAAQRQAQRALGTAPDRLTTYRLAGWIANLLLGVVPTAICLSLMWSLFASRYGFGPRGAFGMTALVGVASLSFPYTTFFYGHQTAAAFFGIGLVLTLLEANERERPRSGRILLAGLCLGMAVLTDFLAVIGVCIWTSWLVYTWRKRPITWCWWALGGLGPAVALLAYNREAFGSWLVGSYSSTVLNPMFRELVEWHWPTLGRVLHLTIGPPRGLFYATPVYAAMVPGIVLAWQQRRAWPEFLFAAFALITQIVLLASWNSWHGGAAVGPRYLVWSIPLITLLLVPTAKRYPTQIAVAAQVTAVLMLAVTVTDPLLPLSWPDPYWGSAVPVLLGLRETSTFTLWRLLGAPPAVALLMYLVIWFIAGRWIDRLLSSARPGVAG